MRYLAEFILEHRLGWISAIKQGNPILPIPFSIYTLQKDINEKIWYISIENAEITGAVSDFILFYALSADLSELRTGSLNSWHEISLDHFEAALPRWSSRKKYVIWSPFIMCAEIGIPKDSIIC